MYTNNNEAIYDLFFTMSHGVNRGTLKTDKTDERDPFINKLIEKNPNIIFDIYGYKIVSLFGLKIFITQ